MSELKIFQQIRGEVSPGLITGQVLLNKVTGIDGKTPGPISLYTTLTGSTVVVTEVSIRCTDGVSISTPITAGVGVAAGEDDIYPSQVCYGLTSTGKQFTFPNGGTAVTVQPGETIKLGIDSAGVGTTYELEADVLGYEV
jgi:hypothetical protein